jgi:DMSO/TMAO reductase YedYZ molybdopterin-dependent catalytic subunit
MGRLDYSNEPTNRPNTLLIHDKGPFNAEPKNLAELIKYDITPSHLVFARNHSPIPDIKAEEYTLTVNGLVNNVLRFSLAEIMAMPKTTIVCAMQVISSGKASNIVRWKSSS